MLVRQECERQKCERHQCEANSAKANSAKGSTVRMRQECECQQCECQQCDATSVRKKCDSSANANSANRIFFSFLLIEKFNNRVLRLPKKKHSLIINITWECKHCGARALDGTIRFRRLKRSRVFSRRCHRSLATCQAMHGDAVKARAGREKTKAMLPRVLTCPFRR